MACKTSRFQNVLERLRRNDPWLTSIDLLDSSIGDEGARVLAEALMHNSILKRLILDKNGIGDEGAKALAEALQHNSILQELYLYFNSIGPEGARALAEALTHNSTLQRLSLYDNSIGDEGARALAEALRHNSTVKKLHLQNNNIGNEAEAQVVAALRDPNRGKQLTPKAAPSAPALAPDTPEQDPARSSPKAVSHPPKGFKQILFENIQIQPPPLGAGNFKIVHKGLLDGHQEVAVLTLRSGACDTEAAVFERLGCHPRLTRLLGTSTDPEDRAVLVTEFASHGSLDRVLESLVEKGINPSNAVLLQCALQVCEGMEQVVKTELIHRDLALRNVLVFEFDAQNPLGVDVKVSDYGLTREGQYFYGGNDALPIRWMPPESLERRRWSEKSDVWAFGVLMWELWSAALTPFAFEGSDENVARRVCKGERLPRPTGCPESVYAVMQKCWETSPQGRPSFRDLRNALLELYGAAAREGQAVGAAREGERRRS